VGAAHKQAKKHKHRKRHRQAKKHVKRNAGRAAKTNHGGAK
jgi:hypothetical protein